MSADEDYKNAAEQLSQLVGIMVGYLEHSPERSVGGVWRKGAELALRRFNAAKMAQQQGKLFEDV